ncbi:MAG: hypothetical protein ABF309_15105, partial [Desulfobacterales bacterium]
MAEAAVFQVYAFGFVKELQYRVRCHPLVKPGEVHVSGYKNPNRLVAGDIGVYEHHLIILLSDLGPNYINKLLIADTGNGYRTHFGNENISLDIHGQLQLEVKGPPYFHADGITDGNFIVRIKVQLFLPAELS